MKNCCIISFSRKGTALLNKVIWLPELLEQANFKDLRHAIAETMTDVEKQIVRMEAMYILVEANPEIDLAGGIVGMIDDAFNTIQKQSHNLVLRDLSMLFYLQNIESLEMASFQVIKMAAVKMGNPQIIQLLKENYDEARDDRVLMLLIAAKYFAN